MLALFLVIRRRLTLLYTFIIYAFPIFHKVLWDISFSSDQLYMVFVWTVPLYFVLFILADCVMVHLTYTCCVSL